MAITYTWHITELVTYPEYEGKTDVVQAVHWILTGDDGQGHTATINQAHGVSLEFGETFTAYNQLTEDQVLQWLFAAMTPEVVAMHEAEVAQLITDQVSAPVVPNLPWGN
jgi:hypothetical protein